MHIQLLQEEQRHYKFLLQPENPLSYLKKQPRQEYATEEVLMTFGDMTRKKEDIVVDASDLEAEAANDSCQRYANSPLESVESSI